MPNEKLDNVEYIDLKSHQDLGNIGAGSGRYWIWTNKPVIHSLHKNPIPKPFNNDEFIYYGIAKDDAKGRVFHHLFGFEDTGWSSISIDLYTKASNRHRKKACSPNGKAPLIKNSPIRNKEQLLKLHLTQEEKNFNNNSEQSVFYFRNEINLNDEKHKEFKFMTGLASHYLKEKEWRKNRSPKLCSY